MTLGRGHRGLDIPFKIEISIEKNAAPLSRGQTLDRNFFYYAP